MTKRYYLYKITYQPRFITIKIEQIGARSAGWDSVEDIFPAYKKT